MQISAMNNAFLSDFVMPVQKSDMVRAALFVGLSYLVLLAYLLLVKFIGGYALPILVLFISTLIFLSAEFSLAFLLTALFMQNSIVAILTEYGHAFAPKFNVMLGTSFAITTMMAVACFSTWWRSRWIWVADNRDILRWTILFSFVVIVYSILGLINSDFKSTLIYDRVYLGGVMFLIIGVVMGSRISQSYFAGLIRVLMVILIMWGLIEYIFQKQLLELFSVIKFMSMKFLDFRPAITSVDELLDRRTYLNLSGDFGLNIYIPRLRGPNMHPISYSYELCFCSLICLMFRSYILAFVGYVMLFIVGAKGAITLATLSLLLLALRRITKCRSTILLLALLVLAILYLLIVITYGIVTSDFHVLGLIGSLKGFLQNPLGRGIGVGGNMSTLGSHNSDLSYFMRYQQQGYADVALESAIGVMLYQMGVATSIFLLFCARIWRKIWHMLNLTNSSNFILLPSALFFILVNGLFQEEAFSPAGWGLWLLVSGTFLSLRWKMDNYQRIQEQRIQEI